MIHPAGTFDMTAETSGYENFSGTLIIAGAETLNKNIVMNWIPLKGDIDGNRQVNLTDAIPLLSKISLSFVPSH